MARSSRRARAAAAADQYWSDAWLDCYPLSGRLGGGPTNTDVVLGINWKWRGSGWGAWAVHYVLFEEYRNGAGPYWSDANGVYTSNSGYWGPYRITPTGVVEWTNYLSNFDGTTTPVLKPWVAGRTFAKFVSTRVRAWVGQSLYNQTNNTWGSITWHPAQALTYRVGDGAGFCGL